MPKQCVHHLIAVLHDWAPKQSDLWSYWSSAAKPRSGSCVPSGDNIAASGTACTTQTGHGHCGKLVN
eukprot:5022336-Prorocentrum_lima.AAC.1